MPPPDSLSRRALLKAASLGALSLSLSTTASRLHAATPAGRNQRLQLGVASISLRELPVPAVISVLKQLEIDRISIHGAHASFEKDTPEKCSAVAAAFRAGGITVATSSVVNLPNDEAAVRRAFANAQAGGLTLMTCRPLPEALPLVERFVKETNIRLAIHNHGPEDALYPSPQSVLKVIAAYDRRIGLCLDAGHAMRSGVDPVKTIRESADRLYDFHLKDSQAIAGAKEDIPVEVGRGRMDIRGILAALLEIKYSGTVAFEYERLGVNPVIGLAESVGYVRGALAGLKA
jgi:sugar phosphate isomerase/epimerase